MVITNNNRFRNDLFTDKTDRKIEKFDNGAWRDRLSESFAFIAIFRNVRIKCLNHNVIWAIITFQCIRAASERGYVCCIVYHLYSLNRCSAPDVISQSKWISHVLMAFREFRIQFVNQMKLMRCAQQCCLVKLKQHNSHCCSVLWHLKKKTYDSRSSQYSKQRATVLLAFT